VAVSLILGRERLIYIPHFGLGTGTSSALLISSASDIFFQLHFLILIWR